MNDDDDRHRYLRLADELRAKITSGELREGDRLPSIPELVRERRISSNTAQRALRVLVGEGLATARSGSGTYVRSRPAIRRIVRMWNPNASGLPSFDADVDAIGSIGYRSTTVSGPPAVRERLGLDALHPSLPDMMRTAYIRRASGVPVFLETSWEPLELTRDTVIAFPEDGPHGGKGLVERMRQIGVTVTHAPEVVSARPATADEAYDLDVAPGATVLIIERTHYAETRPVETADIVVPVDRYQLVYGLSTWDEPAEK